jgi:hypothetical protein
VWATSSVTESRSPQYIEDANGRKPHHPNYSPVESRLEPWRLESDLEFFRARPGVDSRTRLPFPNEFPPDVLDQGGLDCFVHVIVERNSVGHPVRRARGLLFCEGGSA